MFYLYEGDTRDLPTTKDYLNFRWSEADILFSVTKQGNAALIHFTAKDRNTETLKKAANEFCEYIFKTCEWCKMIMGIVGKKSVVKLGEKCGFHKIGFTDDITVMMRER